MGSLKKWTVPSLSKVVVLVAARSLGHRQQGSLKDGTAHNACYWPMRAAHAALNKMGRSRLLEPGAWVQSALAHRYPVAAHHRLI